MHMAALLTVKLFSRLALLSVQKLSKWRHVAVVVDVVVAIAAVAAMFASVVGQLRATNSATAFQNNAKVILSISNGRRVLMDLVAELRWHLNWTLAHCLHCGYCYYYYYCLHCCCCY